MKSSEIKVISEADHKYRVHEHSISTYLSVCEFYYVSRPHLIWGRLVLQFVAIFCILCSSCRCKQIGGFSCFFMTTTWSGLGNHRLLVWKSCIQIWQIFVRLSIVISFILKIYYGKFRIRPFEIQLCR